MKLKSVGLMVAALLVLSLNGCTMMLWGLKPFYTTDYHYQDAGMDNVYAFGQIQQDNPQLKAGSLLMMGDKYWYALDKDTAQRLLPVLNAKLARQYQIKDYSHDDVKGLPVTIYTENQRFNSNFCLHYTTRDAKEITVLQDLSFKKWDKQPETYVRCFLNNGEIFSKPVSAKSDYRFEQSVPVVLQVRTESKNVDVGDLLGRILVTPLTLAADVVLIPIGLLGAFVGSVSK
ncbi:thiosulfate sulfurtransferase [Wielerella bovis]|uniref:thiosulfate sulfurtransferase n=1 Tax=Wielerella bovis TaxID=2917790 RepID=UPI00201A0E26|nr:thiosulfate sulfurtransferase [Wielerella bovis]ULJ69744.1 thiosulfate sulfurtransferase [Wielerella bovis]